MTASSVYILCHAKTSLLVLYFNSKSFKMVMSAFTQKEWKFPLASFYRNKNVNYLNHLNENFMFVVRLLWIAFLLKKECFVKEFRFRAASNTILYLQKMMTTAAGCSWLDYTKAIKKFMQISCARMSVFLEPKELECELKYI